MNQRNRNHEPDQTRSEADGRAQRASSRPGAAMQPQPNYFGEQQYPGSSPGASFRGVGPKSYVRSDQRLQEDICERLAEDDYLDASDISVRSKDGIVTLEGTVSERRFKRRAEDLIEQCYGVKDIENRLSIQSATRQDQVMDPSVDDEDGKGSSSATAGQGKKGH